MTHTPLEDQVHDALQRRVDPIQHAPLTVSDVRHRARRIQRRRAAVAGVAVVVLVAACRVYLGVHWFSDVIQGLLLGSLYLIGVEAVFEWHHRRRRCALFAHLYETA